MKFKVGKRFIRKGSMVCLSKNGTLRAWRNQYDAGIGLAVTDLKKDIIAEELVATSGQFIDRKLYNHQCVEKLSRVFYDKR